MTDIARLYHDSDAVGLAARIRSGDVSATEVLRAAVGRAAETQPEFNYLALEFPERARQRASRPLGDGPLAGVPFLVKDLGIDIAGLPSGMGSRSLNYRATQDSIIVERADAAGLLLFGKTTTPEMGLTISTESAARGKTRNPWNPERIAGGSSGGAAVAVALGAVPLAQGSDGGGSIRVPSSFCGVFGLKTSRGLVPHGPDGETKWNGMAVNGPIARSVRDAAAFMDVLAGPAPGTRAMPPIAVGNWLQQLEAAPKGLKVALMSDTPFGTPIHPDISAALTDAAGLFEALGHHVEPARPDLDWAGLMRANVSNIATCIATDVGLIADRLGHDPRPGLEPSTANWVRMGEAARAVDQELALRTLELGAIALDKFFERFDIILSPTLAQLPVGFGVLSLSNPDHQQFNDTFAQVSPFVTLANMTGTPAITLPLGQSTDGMPIGIMAHGRFGADLQLLQLARQVEQAAPWAGRRPPV